MSFDATINLGHLLTFAGMIAVLVSGWYSMRGQINLLHVRMDTLHERTAEVEVELKRLTDIFDRISKQDVRLAVLEEGMRNLQRVFANAVR